MSLHQKQYREPEGLLHDPERMLLHLRALRAALNETMDAFVQYGSMSYPRPEMSKKVYDLIEETKLY